MPEALTRQGSNSDAIVVATTVPVLGISAKYSGGYARDVSSVGQW